MTKMKNVDQFVSEKKREHGTRLRNVKSKSWKEFNECYKRLKKEVLFDLPEQIEGLTKEHQNELLEHLESIQDDWAMGDMYEDIKMKELKAQNEFSSKMDSLPTSEWLEETPEGFLLDYTRLETIGMVNGLVDLFDFVKLSMLPDNKKIFIKRSNQADYCLELGKGAATVTWNGDSFTKDSVDVSVLKNVVRENAIPVKFVNVPKSDYVGICLQLDVQESETLSQILDNVTGTWRSITSALEDLYEDLKYKAAKFDFVSEALRNLKHSSHYYSL